MYQHAIIVRNSTEAAVLNEYLKDDAKAYPYGYPLCGISFTGYTLLGTPKKGTEDYAERWVNESLKCRLIKKAPN